MNPKADTARRLGLPEARAQASQVLHRAEAERAARAAREDTDGCHRACRNGHTYRWGGCAYADEPAPKLHRFEAGPAEDGYLTGAYVSMDAEQVARWLRAQGYTVAPRASQAATAPRTPGDDAGVAHGADRAAAGRTGPPMRPDDVPSEIVDDAVDAWHEAPRPELLLDDLMRHIIAAAIPTIRAQAVRAERERLAAMLIEHGNREPQTSGFRRGLRAAAQHVAAQNISAEDVARALGDALRSARGDQ